MLAAALLLIGLLAAPAYADSGMLLGGVANRQMPLDPLPAATNCYSERRLRTAYTANKGINIVRASDSALTDIGFTASGYPNKDAETAFCAATTCKMVTTYDQCGSNNLTQAVDANRYTRQPAPGTFGAWNVSQSTANTQTHPGGSNSTPATGLVSLATVARRSAGTGVCVWIRQNGNANRLVARSGGQGLTMFGGTSGSIATTTADVWRVAVGTMTGDATSELNLNGTVTTGTVIGNTAVTVPAIIGGASSTCNWVEAIIWDNVNLLSAGRAYHANRALIDWGF